MKKSRIPKNQLLLDLESDQGKKHTIFKNFQPMAEQKVFPFLHFKPNLNLEKRSYQENCVSAILSQNPLKSNLIVFPAGTGKTYIAARIIDHMIKDEKVKNWQILVLSHRVSLSNQLTNVFKSYFNLEEKEISCLASVTRSKRISAYNKAKIIVSTPQGIANDLKKGILNWNFSFVVFDEVDFAVGDYQYVYIAQKAKENKTTILGLSATVGNKNNLIDLIKTLGIENIFIKLDYDEDIKPYRKELDISYKNMELDLPYKQMLEIIKNLLFSYVQELENDYSIPIKDFLEKKKPLKDISDQVTYHSKKNKKVLTVFAAFLYVYELERIILEESKEQLKAKLFELKNEKEKGKVYPNKIFEDLKKTDFSNHFKEAKTSKKVTCFLEDAKNYQLENLKKNKASKALAIVNSRDFAFFLTKKLEEKGIKTSVYLGKSENFSKKDQLNTLNSFLNSDLEFLVSTRSAIERGIDLPNAEVLFILNPPATDKSIIQLLNRINRSFSPTPANIIIYTGSSYESLKSKISFVKKSKYYQFLSLLRYTLSLEKKKPIDQQRSLIEIVESI